jgi:hypothetical protein
LGRTQENTHERIPNAKWLALILCLALKLRSTRATILGQGMLDEALERISPR